MTPLTPKEIFLEAIELPESDRADFVAKQCEGSLETLNLVTRLMRSHGEAGDFLGDIRQNAPRLRDFVEMAPEDIGGRRIIKKLGQGGFGVVYLAQQETPIRAQVAIKVIRPGMASSGVIARFEAERRALERMKHPNIASVLDVGSTPDGLPYFVLEFVPGQRISDYVTDRNLSLEDRCRLIIDVCMAVQHAHEKSVIHRDIKPSNVIVTEIDGKAVPKVIDFGLAKAVRGNLTDTSALTLANEIVGTPQFMSPEQVSFGEQDVDTKTDVYSLGGLIYTLLTGVLPFGGGRLQNLSPLALEKVIRDEGPTKPSLRVMREEGVAATKARLSRRLKGDLDWIIGKAMEKDRERRYHSAAALASDLQRHLDGKAVDAGPPSRIYRLKKLIGRNRVAFASLSAVLIALVATAIFSYVAAKSERQLRREAEKQLTKFESVASFAEQMLSGLDPAIARGADTTLLRKMLARANSSLDDDRPSEPEVEIQLRTMIGHAYLSIALGTEARQQLDRAVQLAGEHLPEPHRLRQNAESALGQVLVLQSEFEPARILFARIAAQRKKALGKDDPKTLEAQSNLGVALFSMGRYQQAYDLQKEILQRRSTVLGENHQDSVSSRNSVATALSKLDRDAEAVELLEEVLTIQLSTLREIHPRTMATINNLALSYSALGRRDDAIDKFRRLLEIKKRILPAGHPSLVISMNNLAMVYGDAAQPEKAVRMIREALKIAVGKNGKPNLRSLTLLNNLGVNLIRAGQKPEAMRVLEEAATGLSQRLDPAHANCIAVWTQVASLKWELGYFEEGLSIAERMLKLAPNKLPREHRSIPKIHRARARCLLGLKRVAEAEASFLKAFSLAEAAFPNNLKKLNSYAVLIRDFYREQAKPRALATWEEKLKVLQASKTP
ncbi:MAG: serine/threonine-protein kinase [Planctomycetota bacterium]